MLQLFFNQSRGMQMDFSVTFHPIMLPDFADVFLVRVVLAQHEEYLAKEPELDI